MADRVELGPQISGQSLAESRQRLFKPPRLLLAPGFGGRDRELAQACASVPLDLCRLHRRSPSSRSCMSAATRAAASHAALSAASFRSASIRADSAAAGSAASCRHRVEPGAEGT